ncbi:MAG: RNA methyltransferase [Pseudomonadota bacterium]
MTKQKGRKRRDEDRGALPDHGRTKSTDGPVWIWGSHAVMAALANPKRSPLRLLATKNAVGRLGLDTAELVAPRDIDACLPKGAVHQGVALLAHPLAAWSLADLIAARPKRLVVLDQVSDPQNLGAVFRSAAAFGVEGVVLQTRHTPPITGTVAKSAAGAVETVPECRVVNVARAIDDLGDAGYTTIGLAGAATKPLVSALGEDTSIVFVLGAEGAGLRPAVAKACATLAKIPIAPGMESLNLSNAAAICFYEAARGRIC